MQVMIIVTMVLVWVLWILKVLRDYDREEQLRQDLQEVIDEVERLKKQL